MLTIVHIWTNKWKVVLICTNLLAIIMNILTNLCIFAQTFPTYSRSTGLIDLTLTKNICWLLDEEEH